MDEAVLRGIMTALITPLILIWLVPRWERWKERRHTENLPVLARKLGYRFGRWRALRKQRARQHLGRG